ncbi:MAG TPA: acyl-CoA dehydrogenase N-terminal domain-containing protein, partial [Pseudomonadales bacterium]|nr:acyl-CoA dehydrogenase N-terminal domain-containing protein [Pseudomonadales bacterium]
MPTYHAPLRDIQFVLNDLLDISHYQNLEGCSALGEDEVGMILENAGKFAEEVLGPLNKVGDEEGCHFDNGKVTVP